MTKNGTGFFDELEDDLDSGINSEPSGEESMATAEVTDLSNEQIVHGENMEKISPIQKIIVKKLLTHIGSSSPITDRPGGEPGNVEIPTGWIVKQITTTPLFHNGETRHIVITMLLEKQE